jgi:hypothetical protein
LERVRGQGEINVFIGIIRLDLLRGDYVGKKALGKLYSKGKDMKQSNCRRLELIFQEAMFDLLILKIM